MPWRSKSSRQIEAFEDWCLNSDPGQRLVPVNAGVIREEHGQGPLDDKRLLEYFARHIQDAKGRGQACAIAFEGFTKRGTVIRLGSEERRSPADTQETYLWSITITNQVEFSAVNERIHSLGLTKAKKVTLENCWVGEIVENSNNRTKLILKNCWVGNLIMIMNSFETIEIHGGRVQSIYCPSPDSSNPITGSVLISSHTQFPTSRNSKLLQGSQNYRSLRHHLEKLQNVPAANRLRVLELRTERRFGEEGTFNTFANRIYDWCSEYGNKPGRPLILIVVAYLLAAWALFQFNGVTHGLPLDSYHGWQCTLIEPGVTGEISRAVAMPAQSVLSPFGALQARRLLVASHWGWQFLIIPHAIATYLLLLMTILGIRKRFKLP